MRIILNADDLGANEIVNEKIFQVMARRQITSASILANGPLVEEAARRVLEFPHCSFGAHLNISEFQPLTQDRDLEPLLSSSGEFAGNIREVKISTRLRNAVFREWCAQVEKLLKLQIPVSHFDSHHHVHTIPGLFPILKKLRRRFGIRKVRATMNIYPVTSRASAFLRLRKALWRLAVRHVAKMTTTDGFTSLRIFCGRNDFRAASQTVELMVHPGGEGFEEETLLLETGWLKAVNVSVDSFISYNDLN